jgi:hypothetical protein
MNFLLAILQAILGLWNITGGVYMTSHYPELINAWASGFFPEFFWVFLGGAQVGVGITLIMGIAHGKLRKLSTPSALVLMVITLLGIPSYSAYAGFPGFLWGLIPALLLGLIAYKRRNS